MKNETEKKSLFSRLIGSKKNGKGSCCCSFEIEEIPEILDDVKEKATDKNIKETNQEKLLP